MAEQATATDSDTMTVETEAATATGNPRAEETQDGSSLARARDGHTTPDRHRVEHPLPDTDSVRRVLAIWLQGGLSALSRLWSGRIWDEQPPSPRELAERCQDSPWARSDARLLVFLRWAGCVASLAWSLPWYLLAVAGQRFGRALITAIFVTVLWNLI